VAYEVLADGRVLATTNSTTISLPAPDVPTRYFVRAIDTTGNRSATTPSLPLEPLEPAGELAVLVERGSLWQWRYESSAWPSGWSSVGFDGAGWGSGAAPLGFGWTGVATNIDIAGPTSQRPLSAQFRQEFEVAEVSGLSGVTLDVVADDGVVVFVNGAEIGRVNMPTGSLSAFSYATAAPRSVAANANTVSFVVPPGVLREGVNVVAASTHLNWRATPDISFDLGMTGLRGEPVGEPPAAPSGLSASVDGSSVELSWEPGPAEVVGYEVSRDGEVIEWVAAPTSSVVDTVERGRSYAYSVVAFGQSGLGSTPATLTVEVPEGEPEPESVVLVERGSLWQWRYESSAWPSGWSSVGFDGAGWGSGAAPLGFGWTGVATNIDIAGPTSQRPLSAQFRQEFEVAEVSGLSGVTLDVVADDGVVVFVNGAEIGRVNMPTGSLSAFSYATAAPRSVAANANTVSFVVPPGVLREGVNVVAASTHLNWRATPDISFDLGMAAVRGAA
jgi:trimeric autotransporter adhesin